MKTSNIKMFSLFFAMSIALSCTKESDKTYCWQGFDPFGADVTGLILCDKTEAEVQAAYPEFWFYKEGEAKFC